MKSTFADKQDRKEMGFYIDSDYIISDMVLIVINHELYFSAALYLPLTYR